MRRYVYMKNVPETVYGPGLLVDLQEMFSMLGVCHLMSADVTIVAEPGDATRYELIIIYNSVNERILVVPEKEWSTSWGYNCYITSNELPFNNMHTRCVYADLINHAARYYDWETGRPVC